MLDLIRNPENRFSRDTSKMSCDTRKQVFGVSDQVDTNLPVQSQNQAKEEELYYPCSENKGADQLPSYCEADLHLCFHIGENPFFS